LLDFISLISSANNTGHDIEFILKGHLYILWTVEPLEMIVGELDVSIHPSQRKKMWSVLGDFASTFCFPLVK
jgi:hypothetical protein